MIRPVLTVPPKVKTLAQQNTDLTSEGAPPPGKLPMPNHDTAHPSVKATSRAATTMPGAQKRPPTGKNR